VLIRSELAACPLGRGTYRCVHAKHTFSPTGTLEYLKRRRVTVKVVKFTKCTFNNYTTNTGKRSSFNDHQKCAVGYPDYKIQWGRFPLAADWLRECKECTDGVCAALLRSACKTACAIVSDALRYPLTPFSCELLVCGVILVLSNPGQDPTRLPAASL